MGPVWAGRIGVQAQMQYDLLQAKHNNKGVTHITQDGRLSTNYNLIMRRPFLPTSSLMSELAINTTNNNDANMTSSARNWMLNLYSNAPKYQMIGRVNHSTYGTSTAQGFSSSTTTDYNAGLFLREPSYPVLNLQFLRNVIGGNNVSTTWLTSSYYDYAPFRFSYDRTHQTFGASANQTRNQRAAVKMDHTLMPGLVMSGELSRFVVDNAYPTAITSTSTNRRTLRLSATPTRSLVADLNWTTQSEGGRTTLSDGGNNAQTPRHNNNRSVSLNLRSEIMPGVSLDYSDQKQSQTGSLFGNSGGSDSRNRSVSLSARLNDATAFSATALRLNTNSLDGRNVTSQDAIQSALQTSLSRTTDLSLDYGRNKSPDGQDGSFNSSFMGVSIRDRTSPKMSLGATYRRTNVSSRIAGGASLDQIGDIVDVDMLWQPTYDMGVNLRLSYQNNRGSSPTRSISPSANLRWQLDSDTNLTANYTFRKNRQFDPTAVLLGQDTRGLSMRLAHNFVNGSYVDLAYDFLGGNVGDLEWSKQLRMTFTFNL